MDERIEKILKTDADARKRIAKAQQNAEEIAQSTGKEVEKLRIQFEKRIETGTKEIKKDQQKKFSLFKEEKREKNEEILKKLEEMSKENFEKWVEEIFKRTIS